MNRYVSLEHSIRMVCESGGEQFHKVGATVSDPSHTMISKRKETIFKHVRVKAKSEAHAIEKAKAHFKKKGYKVHDAIHVGVMNEDINNSDKFVGNKQTDNPVPVIKPNATQDAKRASLSRTNAKERTSQTMGNNVEEGALDAADTAAEYLVPYYSAGKKLYKGDKAGAAQDAAIDTALLATTGGVGKVLGGVARAGSKLLGGAVRSGEKAAIKAGEKAAVTGAEKAGVSAIEKDAAKVAATDAEKTVAKTAAVDAEKGAAKVAATDAVKPIAKIGAADVIKNAVKKSAFNFKGQNKPLEPLTQRRGEYRHMNPSSVSRAKKVVHEESGDEAREKDQAVPRLSNKKRTEIDYVGRPNSPRSILTRHGEVTRKIIDEDAKQKAKIVKDVVKDKPLNLDDAKTKVYGEVVVNPPLNYKDLNSVDSAS